MGVRRTDSATPNQRDAFGRLMNEFAVAMAGSKHVVELLKLPVESREEFELTVRANNDVCAHWCEVVFVNCVLAKTVLSVSYHVTIDPDVAVGFGASYWRGVDTVVECLPSDMFVAYRSSDGKAYMLDSGSRAALPNGFFVQAYNQLRASMVHYCSHFGVDCELPALPV